MLFEKQALYLADWKHSEGVFVWLWARRIVECMFGGCLARGLYAKESKIQKIWVHEDYAVKACQVTLIYHL